MSTKKTTEFKTKEFALFNESKGVDEENFTVTATISDDTLDRDNEVVLPSSFEKRLPDFLGKHHPLLSSHANDDLKNQLGTIENIKIMKNRVDGTFKYFVGEGNDQADWGFTLAKKGASAYSIRFIPFEFATGDQIQADDDIPSKVKKLNPFRVFKDIELLEVSHVLVQSNRNAVLRAIEKGGLESQVALQMIDKELIELDNKFFVQVFNEKIKTFEHRIELLEKGFIGINNKTKTPEIKDIAVQDTDDLKQISSKLQNIKASVGEKNNQSLILAKLENISNTLNSKDKHLKSYIQDAFKD